MLEPRETDGRMQGADDSATSDCQSPLPKVLVVDDLPANSKLVEGVLEPLACEVVVATSGQRALALLDCDEFAVWLLDVQMPEMDGYELARRAREHPRGKDVPIIFLTAMRPSVEGVHRGYGSGAVDFLFKPLDATVVRSKVQVFLELYAGQRRLASAYEELKAAQARLVQAAKMASLGELVAGIAHEINNPLAFALSHVETVKKCLQRVEGSPDTTISPSAEPDWQRACARLAEVGMGLERIRELVLKLRVFSRLDEGEWKVVSVSESVDSVLMILGHRLSASIAVEREFSAPDLLECYPSLLNQAILNVLANAIDAIDGRGKIVIRTSTVAGTYVIQIADDGPGIPRELRERVLEPFFTTKAPGQGTGLGLSITYSIVRKHGGTLELECPPAGGTSVTLRIPGSAPRSLAG